jgi:tetratricopeptide (TPR) repeat protein
MLNKMSSFVLAALLAGMLSQAAYSQAAEQTESPPRKESELTLKGAKDYSLGNYEEALDELVKARKEDPQSSAAAYYLGATLKKMQRFKEAIAALKDAVALQPPVHEAFLELADAYYALHRVDEALAAIQVCEKEGIEPAQTAYVKGLALKEKHSNAASITAFEQAKAADPKLTNAADFQIATIQHRLGKSPEARDMFQRIADSDPESDIGRMAKQQADALTARINRTKPFAALANIQYQSDSNVILKPENAAVAAGATNKSDTATVLTLRAEYAPQLTLPWGVRFQYDGYVSQYAKLTTYDMQSHTVTVSPSRRYDENTASLGLSYNDTLLDGKRYLNVMSVSPAYAFVTGDRQYAQASVTFASKDYADKGSIPEENRSGSDMGAGISWYRLIAQQKGFINLKYDYLREKTDGADWSMQQHKVSLGVLYPETERVTLALGVEFASLAFDNGNAIYSHTKRSDTEYTVNGQVLYSLTRYLDAQLQYIRMADSSNIDVYTYHKDVVAVGAYFKF